MPRSRATGCRPRTLRSRRRQCVPRCCGRHPQGRIVAIDGGHLGAHDFAEPAAASLSDQHGRFVEQLQVLLAGGSSGVGGGLRARKCSTLLTRLLTKCSQDVVAADVTARHCPTVKRRNPRSDGTCRHQATLAITTLCDLQLGAMPDRRMGHMSLPLSGANAPAVRPGCSRARASRGLRGRGPARQARLPVYRDGPVRFRVRPPGDRTRSRPRAGQIAQETPPRKCGRPWRPASPRRRTGERISG
jgi:hypothetical protein